MDFFAACYRQQGEKSASVLLQQYQYRRKEVVFACVCGTEQKGAGGYMTERLLAWFRGLDLGKAVRTRERRAERLQGELAEVIEETDRELEGVRLRERELWERGLRAEERSERARQKEGKAKRGLPGKGLRGRGLPEGGLSEKGQSKSEKVSLAVFFCIEDVYMIFRRGAVGIYLINTAFGRVCLRRLGAGTEEKGIAMELGRLQADIGLLLGTESFYGHVTESMIGEGLFVREIRTEKQTERHLAELAGEAQRQGGSGMGAILLRTVEHREREQGGAGGLSETIGTGSRGAGNN